MLQIRNVQFTYQDQNPLYEDINYDFGSSWLTAIFGISWSGKTTLLHLVWWMIKPQQWSVIFQWSSLNDLTTDQLAKYRNKNVWFSFQDHVLLEDFDVAHNLQLPFLLWGGIVDDEWRRHLIDIFGIEELLHKSVHQISGWEKERVSLIKSLIHKPDILILDEPGDSLDQERRKKLYSLIVDYAQDHLVILTSHNTEILDICNLQKKQTEKHLNFFTTK